MHGGEQSIHAYTKFAPEVTHPISSAEHFEFMLTDPPEWLHFLHLVYTFTSLRRPYGEIISSLGVNVG